MKFTSKPIIFTLAFMALAASVHAVDNSPLHTAVIHCDKAKIEALIAQGADVNARGSGGWRPLHIAASQCELGIVELLVAKGAAIDVKDNDFGWTPLHRAAQYHSSKKDVIAFFLAKGADINSRGRYSSTPLHEAARTENKDVVELLLNKGADINSMQTYGHTPLDIAIDHSSTLAALGARSNAEIISLLENHLLRQAKNPRELLAKLVLQLNNKPSDSTRRLIIKLASEMKSAPAIPEEARKHFIEGTAIVKVAKNPAQQAMAAQSFTEALRVAPWWGDAYYNLGVAQELAEKYDAAEKAFNFYLLSNPKATEQRDVQDRIYGLSAKRRLLGVK